MMSKKEIKGLVPVSMLEYLTEIEQLHNRVNKAYFEIGDHKIVLGFSYWSVVQLEIDGVKFLDHQYNGYSPSTNKHRGQLGGGQDIYPELFNYFMNLVQDTENIDNLNFLLPLALTHCKKNDLKVIVVKDKDSEPKTFENFVMYSGYRYEKIVKDAIWGIIHLKKTDAIILKDNSKTLTFKVNKHNEKIEYESWTMNKTKYSYLVGEKVYKNLSFLNNKKLIDIENVNTIEA